MPPRDLSDISSQGQSADKSVNRIGSINESHGSDRQQSLHWESNA
ncbi:Uncharacterised protein [Legionella pneumophila]|nr:Uncharacterised protein [Legionella pneumophila]